jgi:hypothetical protein
MPAVSRDGIAAKLLRNEARKKSEGVPDGALFGETIVLAYLL